MIAIATLSHPSIHPHPHTIHTHVHTHTPLTDHKDKKKMALEKTETVLEKVGFKSSSEWWRRIRVMDWPRQIVPDRWATIRKDLLLNSFVFTPGMTKVRVSDAEDAFLVGAHGCIWSERYWSHLTERELKWMVEILYWKLCELFSSQKTPQIQPKRKYRCVYSGPPAKTWVDGKHRNVQMFPFAGFKWMFYQYLSNRSNCLLWIWGQQGVTMLVHSFTSDKKKKKSWLVIKCSM